MAFMMEALCTTSYAIPRCWARNTRSVWVVALWETSTMARNNRHIFKTLQFIILTHWSPGRFQFNFRKVIFKLTLMNGGWGISYEIALRWMPQDLTDDKSTLVQVMAWCHQAISHYLSQCWPRSMSPYGVSNFKVFVAIWRLKVLSNIIKTSIFFTIQKISLFIQFILILYDIPKYYQIKWGKRSTTTDTVEPF